MPDSESFEHLPFYSAFERYESKIRRNGLGILHIAINFAALDARRMDDSDCEVSGLRNVLAPMATITVYLSMLRQEAVKPHCRFQIAFLD